MVIWFTRVSSHQELIFSVQLCSCSLYYTLESGTCPNNQFIWKSLWNRLYQQQLQLWSSRSHLGNAFTPTLWQDEAFTFLPNLFGFDQQRGSTHFPLPIQRLRLCTLLVGQKSPQVCVLHMAFFPWMHTNTLQNVLTKKRYVEKDGYNEWAMKQLTSLFCILKVQWPFLTIPMLILIGWGDMMIMMMQQKKK